MLQLFISNEDFPRKEDRKDNLPNAWDQQKLSNEHFLWKTKVLQSLQSIGVPFKLFSWCTQNTLSQAFCKAFECWGDISRLINASALKVKFIPHHSACKFSCTWWYLNSCNWEHSIMWDQVKFKNWVLNFFCLRKNLKNVFSWFFWFQWFTGLLFYPLDSKRVWLLTDLYHDPQMSIVREYWLSHDFHLCLMH